MLKDIGRALGLEYTESTSKTKSDYPVGLDPNNMLDEDTALAIYGGSPGVKIL